MTTFHEAWVCTDCIQWIANDDTPDNPEWEPDNSVWWSMGSTEEYQEFSNHACDCCRSYLAGSRYQAYWYMD